MTRIVVVLMKGNILLFIFRLCDVSFVLDTLKNSLFFTLKSLKITELYLFIDSFQGSFVHFKTKNDRTMPLRPIILLDIL